MVVLDLVALALVVLVPAVHDVLKRASRIDALLVDVAVSHVGLSDILITLNWNSLGL